MSIATTDLQTILYPSFSLCLSLSVSWFSEKEFLYVAQAGLKVKDLPASPSPIKGMHYPEVALALRFS